MPEIPDFKGPHTVWFLNQTAVELDLTGATFDMMGHPIYLHDADGDVYNYRNIIMTKKGHNPDA